VTGDRELAVAVITRAVTAYERQAETGPASGEPWRTLPVMIFMELDAAGFLCRKAAASL
jgi:hypothetical protein